MIECLSLIIPLKSKAPVAVSHQSSVDWENVLLSTDALDITLDLPEDILVSSSNGKWVPSLTDFRVLFTRHIEVLID